MATSFENDKIKIREPGIEPRSKVWKTRILPLNYSRL